MTAFREPVIGDDLDLETYGRPRTQMQRRPRSRGGQDGGVRTVRISGQATPARRSGLAFQIERHERLPDRAARWAMLMGVFMIVVAIATST